MNFQTVNGAKFYTADDMILRWMKTEGKTFEPQTTAWMFEVMDPLTVNRRAFVDVGASTGFFSIPMALAGHRVVSIEPNPQVLERLHANIELNDLTGKIKVIEAAASHAADEAVLYVNPALPLTSGASIQAPTCRGAKRVTVPTVTIDEICNGIPVRLIKIDVENHEQAVLDGATLTIERERPALMLEANTSELRVALEDRLIELGYRWEGADGRNLLAVPE